MAGNERQCTGAWPAGGHHDSNLQVLLERDRRLNRTTPLQVMIYDEKAHG